MRAKEGLVRRNACGIVLVGALLTAVACSSVDDGFSAYPGPQWHDAQGEELSKEVIAVYPGPEHCQQHEVDFLHLGWPLGTAADLIGDSARQYVRASDGELNEISASYGDRTAAEHQRLDELPPDAIETGFTTSDGGRDVELWLPADRADRAYIVIDDIVEVWARAEPGLGCD